MEKSELKRVQFHDLMNYRFLSSPRFSPDGTMIAFAVHRGDLEGNRYLSCLWLCRPASGQCTQLTFSGMERTFCWTKEGDALLFLSGRTPQPGEGAGSGEKGEQDKPDKKDTPPDSRLYRLNIAGGEAQFLAALPRTATSLWDLGEGRVLLQTVDPRKGDRFEDADYMVFDQIPFNSNGKGFTARRRSRLSLLTTGDCGFQDLTPETMDVRAVRLSDDRRRAVITAADFVDVMPLTTGVWEADLEANTLAALQPQGQYLWGCAAHLGDGLLLTGTDMKTHGRNENKRFFLAANGDLSCLTPDLDRSLHNSIVSDCRWGIGDIGEGFLTDGGRAWYVSTDGWRSRLYSLDSKGDIQQATQTLRSVDDFDVRGGRAAVVGLEGLALQELYLVEDGSEQRLTGFNTAVLEGTDLSVPEYVRLENGVPEGLDCWYMRPVGFEVGKKYPAILHVHGGPKGTFSDVFVHEMQCWAAEGFAVLFCNPRGSDGKGNGFDDIRGKYGTVDYDDLMTFVDWAVQTLPFVDGDRLGVTGGSYGGYMTNWIIGHTNRFRAAVTQRSICNWISMTGMSDIGYYFVPDQQTADVGESVDALWDRSPLKYAAQMRTPTLIIHSDEDHRCELGQGLQLFTALKRGGVESRMCVFKGENHELSRSGRPKLRLARLQEIARWLKERV